MVKRFFQVVVVFFAIYSFVFVPLGKKTALEHLRAIFGTPAAREAAEEVKGGVTRLVRRLQSEARQSTEKTDRRLSEVDAEQRDMPQALEDDEPQAETPAREGRAERDPSRNASAQRDEKTLRGERAQVVTPELPREGEPRAEEAATPRRSPKLRALSAEAPAPVQR
jgi:hypothetical protein